MQEVFEKILGKLNNKKTYFQGFYDTEGKTKDDEDINKATQLAFDDAIEIVKQVAEEYKECALCYSGTPCEYQNKDLD